MVDPVRGVRHFATGIEKGLEILRAFRPRLSSLAVPTFAIDLPEGGGKVALQPDYTAGDGVFWIFTKENGSNTKRAFAKTTARRYINIFCREFRRMERPVT